MEAHVGDHVVVEGAKVGQATRRGEVIEILRGAGGDRLRVPLGRRPTTRRCSPPDRICGSRRARRRCRIGRRCGSTSR